MKTLSKIITSLLLLNLLIACDDQPTVHVDKPEVLTTTPEKLFPTAIDALFSTSASFQYDEKEFLKSLQFLVPSTGNKDDLGADNVNVNNRLGVFYTAGSTLAEMEYIVSLDTTGRQDKYCQMLAMAKILKVYKAWYASDVHGSMAYSEAFLARRGGTDKPKFDTQSELFTIWDNELTGAITTLRSKTTNQISMTKYDYIWAGDAAQWIKTANALRLRMAMRLMHRDESRALAIVNELLKTPASEMMTSSADDCIFLAPNTFTTNSSWSTADLVASKPLLDFMKSQHDPRLNWFFRPNNYSQANIDTTINKGKLKPGTLETDRYVGAPVSPDKVKGNPIFTTRKVTSLLTLDTLSHVQEALFQAEYNTGKGRTSFPIITYAELCFIKAELMVEAKISGDAKAMYEEAVKASILTYQKMAENAKTVDYAPASSTAITDYLASASVAFGSTSTRQLEQIAEQSFIHAFKNYNEAWALIKRTGLPGTTSSIRFEIPTTTTGKTILLPRKYRTASPVLSDWNYNNIQAAIATMKLDAGFSMDMSGRVWWDMMN